MHCADHGSTVRTMARARSKLIQAVQAEGGNSGQSVLSSLQTHSLLDEVFTSASSENVRPRLKDACVACNSVADDQDAPAKFGRRQGAGDAGGP